MTPDELSHCFIYADYMKIIITLIFESFTSFFFASQSRHFTLTALLLPRPDRRRRARRRRFSRFYTPRCAISQRLHYAG